MEHVLNTYMDINAVQRRGVHVSQDLSVTGVFRGKQKIAKD